MNDLQYQHWISALNNNDKYPAYLKIADLIAADIDEGKLQARDRLPPLRDLAKLLKLNYTTVVRAYNEAKSRGLIDSHPGTGSFVKGSAKVVSLGQNNNFDMTMNLPPEPQAQALIDKLKLGTRDALTSENIYTMFRYQDFGGEQKDKEAGLKLLSPLIDNPNIDQILVCPGIHSALVALMSQIAGKGGTVCVESLVYPGLKAIAAQLDIKLISVDCDSSGPIIRSMESLCRTKKISAIYLNPTIQNPTTHTINMARREAIADIALRFSIPIIEDDAYGVLPEKTVSPIVNFAPDLTYYITGLSKCFGAGLRVAYLYVPSKLLAQRISGVLRALSVMASPITNALATHWIMDDSLQQMVGLIREEARIRQDMAANYLSAYKFYGYRDGFHLWLNLPKGVDTNPSVVAAHLRSKNVSVVSSAAFCTNNNPPNAVRICLGGSVSREECKEALQLVSDILEHPSHLASIVL